MVYKNKNTGATIETQCECKGDWEPVGKKEVEKEPKEEKKAKK